MAIAIDIDPHGIARIPFAEMRDSLVLQGKGFGDKELSSLHYHQIRLAAMANAGVAACSLSEVVKEKERRRARFISSTPEDTETASRYLVTEGMLGEVKAAIEAKSAVPFRSLSQRMQLWLILNCIRNHTDLPMNRLREASRLIRACREEGSLEDEVAKNFQWEIDHLASFYLPHQREGSDQLRNKVASISECMQDLFEEGDLALCAGTGAVLSDYSCTSDCYRSL